MNVSVLGCGRWGSFIAWYLNKLGFSVTLWGRPGSARLKALLRNPVINGFAYLSLNSKIHRRS